MGALLDSDGEAPHVRIVVEELPARELVPWPAKTRAAPTAGTLL